jgi:2-polyprenyl-3-methyl-5-hydroxy-6-metoxy-1,4-benzoquinol methylase
MGFVFDLAYQGDGEVQNLVRTGAEIYGYKFDPRSDVAGANILRFVGKSRKVLELGAGPGSISRPLKTINNCDVTAVERDTNSVTALREFCDEVHQLDLNDPDWPDRLNGRQFDNIVMADVLEHLYDPWSTLRRAIPLLREHGSFVVSVPHAGHAEVLACLIDNDFEYRDTGLLDRTHIRFFGMKNIQALFEDAELKIVDFAFVVRPPEKGDFKRRWKRLPSHARAALESTDFGTVYQVVVRAERPTLHPALPGKVLLDYPQPSEHKLKFVAFYLPQLNPIPENDEGCGTGFTEWANTSKAQPLFAGHYQPHIPADLGFYDLRSREVQHKQIDLAKKYGIDAFCFHYYWFKGKKLLERPTQEFLNDQDANIEFCLCWANENLIKQEYSLEADIGFIDSIIPYFEDQRYLRLDGRPVLVIYRPQEMPEPKATALRWREHCRKAGIGEIHLIAALTHDNAPNRKDFKFEEFGYDSGLEFPPHGASVKNWAKRQGVRANFLAGYPEFAASYVRRDYGARRVFRTVVPSWDNTARKQEQAFLLVDANPENYERWLNEAASKTIAEREPNERLIFINAWNEWAEGCHLEPDLRFGKGFLEATHRVKKRKSTDDSLTRAAQMPVVRPARSGLGWRKQAADKLKGIPLLYPAARAIYRAVARR